MTTAPKPRVRVSDAGQLARRSRRPVKNWLETTCRFYTLNGVHKVVAAVVVDSDNAATIVAAKEE